MTTDRASDSTSGSTPDGKTPDALAALYHDATAQDAGPSDAARERVMAYARQQALQREGEAATVTPQKPRGEAANDRRWLRHALGSLAVIGIVGWLTFQHLEEPGAPQLDQSAPASAASSVTKPEAAGAVAPAEESVPAAAPMSAPQRQEKTVARPAPAAERRANDTAQEIAAPAPAPVATPEAPAADALQNAAPTAASGSPAASPPAGLRRESAPAAANVERAAPKASPASEPLPYCDANMDAAALDEQARLLRARAQAASAGEPLPEPAPICRPLPAASIPAASESR